MTFEIRDLEVTFGERAVLHGVSIAVEPGTWLGVIGPNGAGKSTLLGAAAGAVPFLGAVCLDGEELSRADRRSWARSVSWVPQEPVFPFGMTGAEYVMLARLAHLPYLGKEGARDRRVVSETLERLGIAPLAARRLETLSGGERRRIAVGRALAQQAQVLLLDEPTTALDIGRQQDVLELIDSLARERGLSVLAVMHDLTLAGQFADRLVFLEDGRVVEEGTPPEVLTQASVASRYGASVRVLDAESRQLRAVVPVRAAKEEER
ncbi:MAG: ABC transporter ATP-binding protein [Actinomycetota bacterium]